MSIGVCPRDLRFEVAKVLKRVLAAGGLIICLLVLVPAGVQAKENKAKENKDRISDKGGHIKTA